MINYDDFAKVEMTIGKILSAEVVPDADKLLKLTVDLGESEPRQIISGIRAYFDDPEELVGVSCPFVTNLEHRTIRGYESEGMILAASSSDGTFALLKPHRDLPPGTRLA